MPKAAGSLRPCAPRFVRPARQSLLSACPAPCLFPHLRLWPPHLARPLHRAVRAPIPVVSTPAGKPLLCPPLLGGRVRSFGPFRASGRNARGTTGSARKPRPTHKEHGRLLRRRNRARRRPQPLPVAETRHAPVTACRHRIESERLRGGSRPSRPLPAPTIVADRKTSSIFKYARRIRCGDRSPGPQARLQMKADVVVRITQAPAMPAAAGKFGDLHRSFPLTSYS